MPLDFAQYKPRLGELLRMRGIDPDRGNFRCFVHDDGGTPDKWSMKLYGDNVRCFGCGFKGDIYDVIGQLDCIADRGDQYRAVSSLFGGGSDVQPTDIYKMTATAPERFTPDADALLKVKEFLSKNRYRYIRDIEAFSLSRGFNPPQAYAKKLTWWPGIDTALSLGLSTEIMEKAGLLDTTKDRQAWSASGVALRVGLGYKLHYIRDGATVKRESRGGHTFPFPALPEGDTIILVEGELDAVSAHYAGFTNVVAIGGTNGLSTVDISFLLVYDDIIFAFDNDESGRVAAGLQPPPPKLKNYKSVPVRIRDAGYTGEIRYFDWSENDDAAGEKDVDDLVKHGKVYVLKHLIENAKILEVKDGSYFNGEGNKSSSGELRTEKSIALGQTTGVEVAGKNQSDDNGKEENNREVEINENDRAAIRGVDNSELEYKVNDRQERPEQDVGSGIIQRGTEAHVKYEQTGNNEVVQRDQTGMPGGVGEGGGIDENNGERVSTGADRRHDENASGLSGDGKEHRGTDIETPENNKDSARKITADTGRGSGEPGDDKRPELIPPDKIPFQFLGFDREAYYVLPKNQSIALRIPRGDKSIKEKIHEMASPDWWAAYFSKEGKEGPYTDTTSAIQWFRSKEIKRGMYNDDILLGSGAYTDNGKIVVNTGKGICTPNGEWSTYESYTGKNIYCQSGRELVIGDKPWTRDESLFFIDQLRTFSFESELAYYAIAGWCAFAPWASCLRRRPHIWITAKKGEGKTELLNEIIRPAIGESYAVFKDGLTTEAAFRQILKRDNLPIVNDEFEVTRRDDQNVIDGVMTLARNAYSGDSISKGTSNQNGITFTTKITFCFASINVNIKNAADRSRIVVCRMQPSNGRMKRIQNVDGLRGRMFLRLNSLNSNIDLAHKLIEGMGHDARTADTHAPFFASYWMMLSDAPFGDTTLPVDEATLRGMKDTIETIGTFNEREADEDKILERIFQERIRVTPDTELTIAEMLNTMNEMRTTLIYDNSLQRLGIRRMTGTERMGCGGMEVVAIVHKHDEIAKMLRETPFTAYKEVLKRNNAYIGTSNAWIGSQNQSALLFRWDMIKSKYFEENQDVIPF